VYARTCAFTLEAFGKPLGNIYFQQGVLAWLFSPHNLAGFG
jgi:hypothetical protein